MKLLRLVSAAVALAVIGAGLTACASDPGPKVLAQSLISSAEGGKITTPSGITLTVPPGILAKDSQARITETSSHVYDIHIDGKWTGKVGVSMPLADSKDAVVHQVGGTWVVESAKYGDSTVWVSQLSPFTDLLSKAASVVCLTFSIAAFVKCLIGKGVTHVKTDLALWIAEKLGNSCIIQLVLTAFVNKAETVAISLFGKACISSAGESNPEQLIKQAQQQQQGQAPAPAPAQPAPAQPAPAQPAPAQPAPAASAAAPANPAPVVSPSGHVADGGYLGYAKNSRNPSDSNSYYWHYLSICVSNLAPGPYTLKFSSDTSANYYSMVATLPANGCVGTGQQGGTVTPNGVATDWYTIEVLGQFVTPRYQPWS